MKIEERERENLIFLTVSVCLTVSEKEVFFDICDLSNHHLKFDKTKNERSFSEGVGVVRGGLFLLT